MPKTRFVILVAAIGAMIAAVWLGPPDGGDISLESLRTIWSDTLRDTDQLGLRATRMSDADEMRLGREVANQARERWNEDEEESAYAAIVAAPLLPHVRRRGVQYQFRAIQSDEVNAFALPGGYVFVTTGMLEFVQSKDELAAVLGHEISHVDLRHPVERYQYGWKLRKVGAREAGALLSFAHWLVSVGYSQDQEVDADAQGVRLAAEGGYDAAAVLLLFQRMKVEFGEGAWAPAATPAGELKRALGSVIGSYFRTHPPTESRLRKLEALTRKRPR